jgi:hypothetical protein
MRAVKKWKSKAEGLWSRRSLTGNGKGETLN